MPAHSTAKMTARQYRMLGEDPPGVRLELVDGEVEVSPSPNYSHSHIVSALNAILYEYVKERRLGVVFSDLDTPFNMFEVRRPDLLYFSNARRHLITEDGLQGVPDLAVEIISPASRHTDRVTKFALYEKHGITDYWLIDPDEKTLEGFTLKDGRYAESGKGNHDDELTLPPFPGLVIPMGDLWFKH